jgi:rare lipoprotein A
VELIGRAQGTDGSDMVRTLLVSLALVSMMSCARAESGLASFYGGIGKPGEMTCAHRTRPFGSFVTVSYKGRTIRCRVNDRGPFIKGRVIDVSTSAARALGMIAAGVVLVSLE